MSRKNKNIINLVDAKELLEGYGFSVEEFRIYQFRIRPEETNIFFDWYHTTGTLTKIKDGQTIGVGKFPRAEQVADFIRKNI